MWQVVSGIGVLQVIAIGRVAADGAKRRGFAASDQARERLGLLINALGNGLALEKLVDPDAVPDELFGELLVLIFQAFEALLRENPNAVGF